MKPKKERKQILKFALKMADKVIEMKQLQILHQQEKNEEIRLKGATPTAELRQFEFGGFPNGQNEEVVLKKDEPIDEKLKEEVENDPLFKLFDDIFNPNKNKEIIDEIMKEKRFPSGGIMVGIGKKRPNGEKDDCDCPACVLRRTLEGKERGFND